jgi:hypothetical protein
MNLLQLKFNENSAQAQPEILTHVLLECPAYAALRSHRFETAVADARHRNSDLAYTDEDQVRRGARLHFFCLDAEKSRPHRAQG